MSDVNVNEICRVEAMEGDLAIVKVDDGEVLSSAQERRIQDKFEEHGIDVLILDDSTFKAIVGTGRVDNE